MVSNIPENDMRQGEILAPYVGPAPPYNSGTHRYLFYLFKQDRLLDDSELQEVKLCILTNSLKTFLVI